MNLVNSMYGQLAPKHPQKEMKELGITYKMAVPQTMYDCWWFLGCENVPENLPANIYKMKRELKDLIGHGLSKEDVLMLEGKE
tara:strand:+ start:207 stop:455 length:249 start_codon:yes stop_codon:yes gene_type:complete